MRLEQTYSGSWTSRLARRASRSGIAAFAALALGGCSGGGYSGGSGPEGGKTASSSGWAYEREFPQGGPVSLVLRLDKVEASLSDQILLEEELRVEEGFESDFPEYLPEDFEGFSVVEISREENDSKAASAPEGKPAQGPAFRSRRKRLTLEPDRSGDLAVAPLAVYFHRGDEAKESSFLTDEIKIHVKPLEDVGSLSVGPLRGIYEAPPGESSGLALWLCLGGGLAVLLGAAVFLYVRRRPRREAQRVPPHEIAYEALRRLVALHLIENGQVERFFVLLSAILREYIESRFQVRAPERTTEEFLQEASRNPVLDHHRARLSQFLSLCDQVKFALYRPEATAIQGAFDATKQFLNETTSHESQVL
jgi:hypothetical protein